jgi:hypothetical protein
MTREIGFYFVRFEIPDLRPNKITMVEHKVHQER